MNRLMTFLCSCPLLLVSGAALCINQDIENIYSSPYTQEQINQLQQSKNKTTGYPVVSPETVYNELGPDRYKSPEACTSTKMQNPQSPSGLLVFRVLSGPIPLILNRSFYENDY